MRKIILILLWLTTSFISYSRPFNEVKVGEFIRYNGEIVEMKEILYRTPSNLKPFYQVKMSNLKTRKIIEIRFRVNDEVEVVNITKKEMTFVYYDSEFAVIMDITSFEQMRIPKIMFPNNGVFVMPENTKVTIFFDEGNPVKGEYPPFYILEVQQTAPPPTGAGSNIEKSATLENGLQIKVPSLIKTGDKIKVDPIKAVYIEKVK